MATPNPGVLILLNGYPGVGKSSVAKELLKIMPNAKLLEYHSLRAVIDPLIDREKDTDRWMEMKKSLLQTLLNNLGNNPPSSSLNQQPPIYIITSHLCATPRRLSVLHSHLSSLPLIHIILTCSTETNLNRLRSSSRIQSNLNLNSTHTSSYRLKGDGNGSSPSSSSIASGNRVNTLREITNENRRGNASRNGNGNGNGNGRDEGNDSSPNENNTKKGKIIDESTLYELRMEEELGRFYASGGTKSAGSGSLLSASSSSSVKIIDNKIDLKEKGLLGEYEVNTENLEINQTAMIVSEYIIEALRETGWWVRLNPQRSR
ncbi:uncharacterized protein IL334_000166 [Kwoniella shivajii]|uniref:Zeta toxin domain-containing protein n=1 Tax=Kwoniella shivajii TaxID=564305 RepID=A0ABZ1CNE6_9TREE|nr:hypothetical protein IL334_000166 [Kwoniella shivajii]